MFRKLKRKAFRSLFMGAVGAVLALSLTVSLLSGVSDASAATSLPYIEKLKDTKAVFQIFELVPEANTGVIGYFAGGQEPVSYWREELKSKIGPAARSAYFSGTEAGSVFTRLRAANILSDSSATPLTVTGASSYAEVYPWIYVADSGSYPGYTKLTLSKSETAAVTGAFTTDAKNSGPFEVNYAYTVDMENGDYLQNFTDLKPIDPDTQKVVDCAYYQMEFSELPDDMEELPAGTPVFTAVYEEAAEGEPPIAEPEILYYKLHGIRGTANFPGLSLGTTYYIVNTVKSILDLSEANAASTYVYQATADGYLPKPVVAEGASNPLTPFACYTRSIDGYTWRGYNRNGHPLGDTSAVLGAGETVNVSYSSIYFRGGYVNNEWLLKYGLDATTEEMANTAVSVTSLTPQQLRDQGLTDFSNYDLIVLTAGLSDSAAALPYTSRNDLTADQAAALLTQCTGAYATPVMVDYRLALSSGSGLGYGNVQKLTQALLCDAAAGTLNSTGSHSLNVLSAAFTARVANEESFLCGSLYCFYPLGGNALPQGNTFYSAKLDAESAFHAAGFSELVNEVEYENFLRKQQNPSTTDLLDKNITTATCLRYIVNFKGRRIVNKATQIRVLELQPCNSSELLDGGNPNYSLIRSWFGLSASEMPNSKIHLTTMSTSEYIGKINDINEDFDVVYIGASTGNLHVAGSDNPYGHYGVKKGETIYNDTAMDGLLYTNIGDLYSANYTLSGLLDRDYSSSKENGYNKINNAAGSQTTTFRFSGNDLTAAKVTELQNFAKAGYPVIVSNALLDGVAAASADLSYSVSVTWETPDATGVWLNAEAAIETNTYGVAPAFSYTWRNEANAVVSNTKRVFATPGHQYRCEVTAAAENLTLREMALSRVYSVDNSQVVVSLSNASAVTGSYVYDSGEAGMVSKTLTIKPELSYSRSTRTLSVEPVISGGTLPAGYTYSYQWKGKSYYESRYSDITASNFSSYDITRMTDTSLTFGTSRKDNLIYCRVSIYDQSGNFIVSADSDDYDIWFQGSSDKSTDEYGNDRLPTTFHANVLSSSYELTANAAYERLDTGMISLKASYIDYPKSDETPSYQWYKNDDAHPIRNATAAEYRMAANDGASGVYYCKVTLQDLTAKTGELSINCATSAVSIPSNTDWKSYQCDIMVNYPDYYGDNWYDWRDNYNFSTNAYMDCDDNPSAMYFAVKLDAGDYTISAKINPPNNKDVEFYAEHNNNEVITDIVTVGKDNSSSSYYSKSLSVTVPSNDYQVIVAFRIRGSNSSAYVKDIEILRDSVTCTGDGAGTPVRISGATTQTYDATLQYEVSGQQVAMTVLTPTTLPENTYYTYNWLRDGISSPSFPSGNAWTVTADDTAHTYSCVVKVGKHSANDKVRDIREAQAGTLSVSKAIVLSPTGIETEGVVHYAQAGSQSVKATRVDACSKVYTAIDSILDYENVMTDQEAIGNTSTSLLYLNFSKPGIQLIQSPLEYDADRLDDPGYKQRTLSFTFKIGNPTDATPAETSYDVRLFIDMNADGRFTATGEGSEKLADILVYKVSGGSLSPVYPDGSGKYALRSDTEYCIRRDMPSDYWGILPWKLEVVKSGAEYIHASESGFTRIARDSDQKVTIRILQIRHKSGEGLNLKDNTNYKNLYKNLPDFKLEIYTNSANKLDTSSTWEDIYDSTKKKASLSAYLNQFDMLVLGFADMYQQISTESAQAILAFSEEKSVLFTHDTTSVVNLPTNYYPTTDGSYITRGNFWGYNFNALLRDAVSLDRYGVTNPTYGQTKYSPLNSKSVSGIVAGTGNTNLSRANIEALENSGYSIAYKPSKDATAAKTTVGEVQGYTKLALTRYTVDYGSYTQKPTAGGTYNTGNANTTTSAVSQVNKGQITTYPYNINTKAFLTQQEITDLGSQYVGDYVNVAETHEQYYQLNMNSDDIVVWYCLSSSDSSSPYYQTPNDVVNAYYIYSVGNITYSGAGHSGNSNYQAEEAKLFINTMIAAYRTKNTASSVSFTDTNGNAIRNKLFGVDAAADALMNEHDDSMSLYFRVNDTNLTTKTKKITVKVEIENAGSNEMVEYGVQIRRGDGALVCNNSKTDNYTLYSGVPYKFTFPPEAMQTLLDRYKSKSLDDLSPGDNKCTIRLTVSTSIGGNAPLISEPTTLNVRLFELMPLG